MHARSRPHSGPLRAPLAAVAAVAALACAGTASSLRSPQPAEPADAAELAAPPARFVAPAAWRNDLAPVDDGDWCPELAAHLLERAGFGGTPREVAELAALSPAEAVDRLLDYERIDAGDLPPFEPSGIYPRGHKLIRLQEAVPWILETGMAFGVVAQREGDLPYQPVVNEYYALWFGERMEMQRAALWWGDRMVRTPRPLEEKLALFWHDHFATSQAKVMNHELMLRQIETLRAGAKGSFRALLRAVARDPAMLIWLDNRINTPDHPNENFARELMELFVLGEGAYTEHDVREVARAFTGLTLPLIVEVGDPDTCVEDPALHDDGEKTILGRTGRFDGDGAIDVLLDRPEAPRFLAAKLYRAFVRDELDADVHARLAQELLDRDWEVAPLLRTLFLSRDFYAEESRGTQVKSPVQLLVGTARKLGLERLPGIPDFVATADAELGQLLFEPPDVSGWRSGDAWINPATLLARGNYAHGVLFPEPELYWPPDKAGPEEYRRIPLAIPQYGITPHVWSREEARMVPVTSERYERYLAALGGDLMDGGSAVLEALSGMDGDDMGAAETDIPPDEAFNLAVGVYTGYVEAYGRVRPRRRDTARIDCAALAEECGARSAAEAVDGFARRFLCVPLRADRRAALVAFLERELGGPRLDPRHPELERALRRTLYLLLCAPEYQLG